MPPYRFDCLLRRFERKQAAALKLGTDQPAGEEDVRPELVEKGHFCELVVQQVRSVRHSCVKRGWSINEHRRQYPNLAVWTVADAMGPEDRETFGHPNQWGPATGYAHKILCAFYNGAAEETVRSWRKEFRRTTKQQDLVCRTKEFCSK